MYITDSDLSFKTKYPCNWDITKSVIKLIRPVRWWQNLSPFLITKRVVLKIHCHAYQCLCYMESGDTLGSWWDQSQTQSSHDKKKPQKQTKQQQQQQNLQTNKLVSSSDQWKWKQINDRAKMLSTLNKSVISFTRYQLLGQEKGTAAKVKLTKF